MSERHADLTPQISNTDAESASFFVERVLADNGGLTPEQLQSSNARLRRVMGLMGIEGAKLAGGS